MNKFRGFGAQKNRKSDSDIFLDELGMHGVKAAWTTCGAIADRAYSFTLLDEQTREKCGFLLGVNLNRLSDSDKAVMLEFIAKVEAMADVEFDFVEKVVK